jgi:2-oxoglutarate dehydrogenase E2 component (dihydrolipoamide succinyltransferase)
MEFVTAAEVRKRLAGNSSLESSATNTNAQRTGTPARLSMHKRAETQSLSAGAGASMLSVLGTSLGRIALSRKSGGIFDDRISDLVIYESSRLMMKYSKLNSYFLDGAVHQHASIVAGFAIDEGGRLVVYGIQNPHLLGLAEIQTEVMTAVSKYVERTLTVDEMSRATYTISDLSAQPLDFMFPLLPERQSCIIGITRAINGEFRLYAGFDHRVTEGREVALFLEELRSRLVSFGETSVSNAKCFFCEKSLLTEIEKYRNKGLVKIMNGFGSEVHCCLSCLNGL